MTSAARQVFLRLAFLGFTCRALIPVGFMPAALADGGPITVCHGGPAGAFFQALADRRPSERAATASARAHGHVPANADAHAVDAGKDPLGHPDERATEHAPWERCAIGAAFSPAVLTGELSFQIPALDHAFDRAEPIRPPHSAFVRSYRARAPPTV